MEIINAKEWCRQNYEAEGIAADKMFDAELEKDKTPLKMAAYKRAERIWKTTADKCELGLIIDSLTELVKSGTITLTIPEFNMQEVTLKW